MKNYHDERDPHWETVWANIKKVKDPYAYRVRVEVEKDGQVYGYQQIVEPVGFDLHFNTLMKKIIYELDRVLWA